MKIHVVKAKAYGAVLDQNTYVLEKGEDVLLIDAGSELEDVKKVVGDKKVLAVLITHCHFDHICCLGDYLKEWKDLKVFIVQGAEEKFLDSKKNCSCIFHDDFKVDVSNENIEYYSNKIKIESFDIDVIFTPGHSADCVCLLIEKKLFCGDLVLGGSIGRCDLYDSDISQMWDSLEKLKNVDFDVAYPGHYFQMTKDEILKSF